MDLSLGVEYWSGVLEWSIGEESFECNKSSNLLIKALKRQ